MSQEPRREQISELVRQRGFMSIEALADHFSVTAQTIRRDINQLCEEGLGSGTAKAAIASRAVTVHASTRLAPSQELAARA